jgi:uncharacterized protein
MPHVRLPAFAFALVLSWVLAGGAAAAPVYPPLTGRVVDEAGLLSPAATARITAQLEAHEKATSNQVVVAIVKSLQGYEIEDYGVGLARAWGIGQQGRNNGVVLIVAPSERRVRIEVGYGLEGNLTDAISSDIIRTRITPAFRDGRFEAGIQEGVNGIIAAIDGAYQPMAQPEASPIVPILMVLAFFFLIAVLHAHRRQHGGGYGLGPYWGGPWGGSPGGFGGRGSSGGFGGGGGGFRGGGGSFGGGGASGRW